VGGERWAYIVLVGDRRERDNFDEVSIDGRMILTL